MYSIKKQTKAEYTIKKSKFISYLININSRDEALEKLEELKKEYSDATHYCYAYKLENEIRFKDDNEPTKTAGLPILKALESKNLNYCICIVIRYFGGIKLGTGPLARAYYTSALESINKAQIVEYKQGKALEIIMNYEQTKVIDNLLKNSIIKTKKYETNITYIVEIEDKEFEQIKESLINNSIKLKNIKDIYTSCNK